MPATAASVPSYRFSYHYGRRVRRSLDIEGSIGFSGGTGPDVFGVDPSRLPPSRWLSLTRQCCRAILNWRTLMSVKKKTGGAFALAQRLGRSLMLPIATLPAAGLLLRLGQADMLGPRDWPRRRPGCSPSQTSSVRPVGRLRQPAPHLRRWRRRGIRQEGRRLHRGGSAVRLSRLPGPSPGPCPPSSWASPRP